MGTSVWKTAALALAAAALPLTAAPAAASQAVSRVTVRVLPLDALLLRQRAALSAPAPLDLLHRSEADLKVTAECLGAGRLSLSVSGSAPASLCGPEDG
ncbi:MAG: hypothetical protein KGK30_03215, partial [Elusimicrobia bacterium]|nr:hypothetical protein [Elusimicrobiota bacterium]